MTQLTTADPIWQDWNRKFLHAKQEPLSQAQAENLIALSFLEHACTSGNEEALKDQQHMAEVLSQNFPGQVFDQHAARIGLKASPLAKAYALLLTRNVGTVVMLVHLMRYTQLQMPEGRPGAELLSLNDLIMSLPNGFPNEEELTKLWDEQKLKPGQYQPGKEMDNMLDHVVTA